MIPQPPTPQSTQVTLHEGSAPPSKTSFFARYSKAIVGAFSGESLAQIISGAAAALGHPLPPIASVAVQILAPVVSTVLAPANATPPAP